MGYSKIFVAVATFVVISYQGCGQNVGFDQSAAASSNSVNNTTTGTPDNSCPLQNVTRPVKILFMVDTSGSNASGGQGSQASDPSKTFRGGSISDFFSHYQTKSNFTWALDVFSGTSASQLGSSGFGSAANMQAALTAFDNVRDSGNTPYDTALNKAVTSLRADPDISSTSASAPLYFVIFMSDGMPNPSISTSTLQSDVAAVLATAPGRVVLSAVYYNAKSPDANAAALLQSMASYGKGQFINADTTSASTISVDDLIQVPSTECN